MYLLNELNFLPFMLLLALWWIGGYLLLYKHFNTSSEERLLLAFGVGLVANTWLSNLMGRFVPTSLTFWLSAGIIILFGYLISAPIPLKNIRYSRFPFKQFILFIMMSAVFSLIGRGFGFFDDHQNLPAVSMMAAGDIPPHFAFNPSLMFGYHYFLLLVGSSFVRIAKAGPWAALDIARGLTLALTLIYSGFLAHRITKSRFAQAASMVFVLFAGGARWILLLLPASLLRNISSSITLIGSGADSGPNFVTALLKNWNIEGQGPFPLPFMYGSGLDPSFSMFHNGWGTSAIMMVLLLILLANIKKPTAVSWLPFTILLSSLALANEVTFIFLYIGFVLAALIWSIQNRSSMPLWKNKDFITWFTVFVVAGMIALIQGGMISEIFFGFFKRSTVTPTDTYFKVSFALGLPTFLSSHLGSLSLLNPYHWLPIIGETGLTIFAIPFVVKQLGRSIKKQDWIESAWIISLFISLAMVFFTYTGNAGPTAISRMQAHFLSVGKLFAVPLVWVWAKKKTDSYKFGALAWGILTIFSGISLFGTQLAAMTQPIYAIYLTDLDAKMFKSSWNSTPPNGLIFDSVYPRAATIFGRPIRSSKTMGETLPEWNSFNQTPDPYQLNSAGYTDLYADLKYFAKNKKFLQIECVKLVDKAEVVEGNKVQDGRYLFDISSCK